MVRRVKVSFGANWYGIFWKGESWRGRHGDAGVGKVVLVNARIGEAGYAGLGVQGVLGTA